MAIEEQAAGLLLRIESHASHRKHQHRVASIERLFDPIDARDMGRDADHTCASKSSNLLCAGKPRPCSTWEGRADRVLDARDHEICSAMASSPYPLSARAEALLSTVSPSLDLPVLRSECPEILDLVARCWHDPHDLRS